MNLTMLSSRELLNFMVHKPYFNRTFSIPFVRTMVLLPDKVPLPSLLVDPTQLATSSAHNPAKHVPAQPLTDAQFLQRLAEDKLPGWGHEVKLHIVYLLLCRWGRSSRSIDAILAVLQGIERAGHHLTLSYFWVQMVTYHMAVEAKAVAAAAAAASSLAPTPVTVFAAFGNTAALRGAPAEEMTLQSLLQEEGAAAPEPPAPPCMAFADFLLRPHCQPLRNALLYNK